MYITGIKIQELHILGPQIAAQKTSTYTEPKFGVLGFVVLELFYLYFNTLIWDNSCKQFNGGLIQGLLDLDGRNSQKYLHQT